MVDAVPVLKVLAGALGLSRGVILDALGAGLVFRPLVQALAVGLLFHPPLHGTTRPVLRHAYNDDDCFLSSFLPPTRYAKEETPWGGNDPGNKKNMLRNDVSMLLNTKEDCSNGNVHVARVVVVVVALALNEE